MAESQEEVALAVVRRLDMSIAQAEEQIAAAKRRDNQGLADHYGSLLNVLKFIRGGPADGST